MPGPGLLVSCVWIRIYTLNRRWSGGGGRGGVNSTLAKSPKNQAR